VTDAALQDALWRLQAAEKAQEEAENAAHAARRSVEERLAARHGLRSDAVILGTHSCHGSPAGVCYYNTREDPVWDFCLVCGDPDERK
jgi:hypothetical protein